MEATDTVEAHPRELGIALPRPPKPIGAFRYGRLEGFVSGFRAAPVRDRPPA
jgi:hypothetical protein